MHQLLKNGRFRSGRRRASLPPIRLTASMGAVDKGRLLEEVSSAVDGSGDRARKATGIVGAIRRAGAYRWVGLYEVAGEEIVNTSPSTAWARRPTPVSPSPKAWAARLWPRGRPSSWET
jgi:hypothetical protein